jgi:hypothetical protein
MHQDATGRPLPGFTSGNRQHPDMICEGAFLGPGDLIDEHENYA